MGAVPDVTCSGASRSASFVSRERKIPSSHFAFFCHLRCPSGPGQLLRPLLCGRATPLVPVFSGRRLLQSSFLFVEETASSVSGATCLAGSSTSFTFSFHSPVVTCSGYGHLKQLQLRVNHLRTPPAISPLGRSLVRGFLRH